jgi:hypothetical protein
VALKLELAQTVALGPFNPYIISPLWLVKVGLLPGGQVNVLMKVFGEGGSFLFHGIEWEVSQQRLVISSLSMDCGELLAKILDLLPHTPVQGVGHNFHFVCGISEWGSSPCPQLGSMERKDLGEISPIEQTRWAGLFLRRDARVEVTVAQTEERMMVLMNYHRGTNPYDFRNAVAAARTFQDDRNDAAELLRRLAGQEVMP